MYAYTSLTQAHMTHTHADTHTHTFTCISTQYITWNWVNVDDVVRPALTRPLGSKLDFYLENPLELYNVNSRS